MAECEGCADLRRQVKVLAEVVLSLAWAEEERSDSVSMGQSTGSSVYSVLAELEERS